MNADEKAIVDYLKGWPHSFVSGKEIARKACGKSRFEDDRGWALPVLAQMVRLGFIEADPYGSFKLKSEDKKKKRDAHVSPQILRILKSSGKSFDGISVDHELEDETPTGQQPGTPLNKPS
jgi:hypothetical protein